MIAASSLAGALLMMAVARETAASAVPAAAVAASHFAPPVNRPMIYRVTTRRLGRHGALLTFSLIYGLEWRRAGRGYQLDATLERIESDAQPDVTRALTAILQPLVGEKMVYLVASDGSTIDLVDADRLWERALARTAGAGTAAAKAEAKQLTEMIASLSQIDRDRLATADIRALVAPASAEILSLKSAASVSIIEKGALQTIAKVEHPVGTVGQDTRPMQVDMLWSVDTATGLVMREQKQSWIVEAGSDARTLIEERVRALILPDQP